METQTIQVRERAPDGKRASRKLRHSGSVPGVLYGHKEAPVAFEFDPKDLRKCLRTSGVGRNTVFKVEGLPRGAVLAIIKDSDLDPVRREVTHVDLIEVRDTDRVDVEVPVHLDGKPAGVVEGGVLQAVSRVLPLTCSPLNIPREIRVDVTALRIGHSIHGGDVALPAGVSLAVPPSITLATVKAPRDAAAATAEDEAADTKATK
ncbi:MAG: 50S ribosomal protein L25 [Deltaproteobacteria bacterium]|nr:50S ribosomal protein L25 [Deltaproteobacteria bacterium]